MAHFPPGARRRSLILAVAALLASTSLVLPASVASGKKDDEARPGAAPASFKHDEGGEGGEGQALTAKHDHGGGGGDDDGGDGPGNGHGNGHAFGHDEGHGNGHGHGRGGDEGISAPARVQSVNVAAPAPKPATSAPAPTASAPAPAPAPASSPTPSSPVTATPTARSGRSGKPRAAHRRAARVNAQRARRGRTAVRGSTATARARRNRIAGHAPGTTPRPGVVGPVATSGASGAAGDASGHRKSSKKRDNSPLVVRTLERVVQVIPGFIKAVIAVLALLLLIASVAWALLARTARFLRRQREMLLGEIGVLQGALLPNVPAELSRLHASVAYRPAEGLAAGGDFYDAFPLGEGRVGIVVGDVAGHGKDALMHTALLRYTLRAYLEADLEPRVALQVAGRSLDRGFDTLATVVLAVYDPTRHVLRYASAGHPPPVFLGDADHVPVTQASSPPIGAGMPTGLRQTTVSLPAGSAVCLFTDGLIEARRDGELIGRLGLVDIIRELGPAATARQVLDRVAAEADAVADDMAACMFRVSDGQPVPSTPRVEEIEVRRGEDLEATLGRFLSACDVSDEDIATAIKSTGRTVRQFRGAVVRVSLPRGGARVEVRPANVETFASVEARRAAV